VGLLRVRQIPFQICGGLAAQGYGAERELNDIDLFVHGEHFATVVQAGQAFISKPAGHFCEEGWDLTYVQFKQAGIKVEVGNAEGGAALSCRKRDLGAATHRFHPLPHRQFIGSGIAAPGER